MFRVLACLTEHHNFDLVLLALCVCIASCAGAAFVLRSLEEFSADSRQVWRFLAGLLLGGGAWATHFVAMLAFDPGLPVEFGFQSTLASAFVGIVLAWAAVELLSRVPRGQVIGSGLLLAGAVVALHYVGMNGLLLPARKIWQPDLVTASWLGCVAFAIPALLVLQMHRGMRGQIFGVALLVGMVLSLHFTGMGALVLVPDGRLHVHGLDRGGLATIVTIGAMAVLSAGVILSFSQRRIVYNLRAMTAHDPLTGLPNQSRLDEMFDRLVAGIQQGGRLAVASIDLDKFADFNMLHGRAAGDEALIQLSTTLKAHAGANAFVARTGGDEFVLLAPLRAGDDVICRMAALVDHLAAPIVLGQNTVSVSASIGVAIAPEDGVDLAALMRRADIAVTRCQEDGRARFAFFASEMDAQILERAVLEQDVRAAVAAGEIEPQFQPLVSLANQEIVGFEILARWRHAARGDVPPSAFIPRIEKLGLMPEFTYALLAKACRAALEWPTPLPIALNVSAEQLRDPFLPQALLRIVTEAGFSPQRLKIEITEDALVRDIDLARSILMSVKRLGMRVALDDFGTGYSSLRHIRELPFDTLKIDQSFVRGMLEFKDQHALVRTIIQMAQNLGLQTIAEGIESPAVARALVEMGCDIGQGYLYGRAMSGDAAATFLAHRQSGAGEAATTQQARRFPLSIVPA